MDFFKNKIVRIVAWSMITLGIVALLLGGITQDEINKGVVLIFAAIVAVGAVIAFICGKSDSLDLKKLNKN